MHTTTQIRTPVMVGRRRRFTFGWQCACGAQQSGWSRRGKSVRAAKSHERHSPPVP
jgi:hypothetical protein